MPHKKTLVTVGYVLFGLASLLFSFYLTFPADALAQRLTHEIQAKTHGAWSMKYDRASMYHLSGIALEDVTLQRNVPAGEPLTLRFDALRGRLRFLPLLLLQVSIDAEAALGDGVLSGRVTPHTADAMSLRLEADHVELNTPPLLGKLIGLPLGGVVTGSIDADWERDLQRATAHGAISWGNAKVGPGNVVGFSLPNVEVGQIDMALELKDAKLRFTSFKQKGGNVSLQASGHVLLKTPLEQSGAETCFAFRADPNFLNNNPKIRVALQLAEVQLKKDNEGYLHVPLTGSVSAPQLRGGMCRQ